MAGLRPGHPRLASAPLRRGCPAQSPGGSIHGGGGGMMRRLCVLALTLAIACSTAAVHAQPAWPTKPIRILVGYAPGGSTDVTARIIAQALSERLGPPRILKKRPRAAGTP